MDTVFTGSDEDGVRFLPEFLTDYESTFKTQPEAGCRKCLVRYYQQLTSKINKMNTKTTSNFRLKAMYNGIQAGHGSNQIISNASLTDEIAIDLLDNHPHGEKLFDVIPDNVDEIREAAGSSADPAETSREDQIGAMKRDELNKIAEGLGLNPSEYRKKADVAAAILTAEAGATE